MLKFDLENHLNHTISGGPRDNKLVIMDNESSRTIRKKRALHGVLAQRYLRS